MQATATGPKFSIKSVYSHKRYRKALDLPWAYNLIGAGLITAIVALGVLLQS